MAITQNVMNSVVYIQTLIKRPNHANFSIVISGHWRRWQNGCGDHPV